MNRIVVSTFACLVLSSSIATAQDKIEKLPESSGVISAVTLYRDRAIVTREIPVAAGASTRTIVVADLPKTMVSGSIYASGDDNTTIRAVRVSQALPDQSQKQRVAELDRQLAELNQQQEEIQHTTQVVTKNLDLLDKLINFSSSSVKLDINRGVLDAKALTEVAAFSMAQRRELAIENFNSQKQLKEIGQQIQRISQQRSLASQASQAWQNIAKILVETTEGRPGTVRLSYQVNHCGWTPQYIARGLLESKTVELEYDALVTQMSGENWKNVSLTLSTASPSVNAARPMLTALQVTSSNPSGGEEDADPFAAQFTDEPTNTVTKVHAQSLPTMLQTLRAKQREANFALDGGQFGAPSETRDLSLNSYAGKLQQIELQAEAKSLKALAPDVANDVASQVYELQQPISISAQRDQQLVQIAKRKLAGTMYHVATPLLSTYAYREAEVVNSLEIGLLAGTATVYLDNQFVGRTEIPPTASGQKLVVGFGADQQVRTRRELVNKHDSIQGGNRQLKFDYKLVLSNFKDAPISVRLIDRLPTTREKHQVSVALEAPQTPLSTDALYLRTMRPTGLLRWDITVPQGRHGSNALDTEYSYTMEFDRQRVPSTNHSLDELQAALQDAQFGSGGGGGFGGGGGGFGGGGMN